MDLLLSHSFCGAGTMTKSPSKPQVLKPETPKRKIRRLDASAAKRQRLGWSGIVYRYVGAKGEAPSRSISEIGNLQISVIELSVFIRWRI